MCLCVCLYRKCCQYCRFRRCNEIGMEKGWVMTEVERSQLLKSRLERKQRLLTSKSSTPPQTGSASSQVAASPDDSLSTSLTTSPSSLPSSTTTGTSATEVQLEPDTSLPTNIQMVSSLSSKVDPASRTSTTSVQRTSSSTSSASIALAASARLSSVTDLTAEDIVLIEELVNCHIRCCPLPFGADRGSSASATTSASTLPSSSFGLHEGLPARHLVTRSYVLQLFYSAIRQFSNFAQQLSSFQRIRLATDRETLLRASVLEMLFLRSALAYDARLKGWRGPESSSETDEALIYFEDVRELVDDERLLEKHKRFMKGMQVRRFVE